jgi:hypothetical protein
MANRRERPNPSLRVNFNPKSNFAGHNVLDNRQDRTIVARTLRDELSLPGEVPSVATIH